MEKRQALCNAISGSSAAAARYMVQWIRIYCIEMLPTLASEALYDAQRSFLQFILLAVVERQPAVAVDAFVALKVNSTSIKRGLHVLLDST